MAGPFNGYTIEKDEEEEAILRCRLEGFKPKHTNSVEVKNNILYVKATVKDKDYMFKVRNIGVDNQNVVPKPSNGHIDVVIRKPSPDYSLAARLPKE